MRLKELFAADVTRDIPPVVYFHEQDPNKLAVEVSEYIITGGYPEGHPAHTRLKHGIHEQYVRLLKAISTELAKPGGPELPASWISGFYGSGKSSFAKLLGLALDERVLPDGRTLSAALLARDDSPRREELQKAWEALRARVAPLAIVFDIGGVARDDEHIHSAVVRQVQARLGYCRTSSLVADHELKLEEDGQWPAFEAAALKALGRPWAQARDEQRADEHFSHVLHEMDPRRYQDPLSWLDARAGAHTGEGTSASEAVEAIRAMLERRAKDRTLFIVVDEVSQYVHQERERMLKLQSFVSELGQRLRGRVWLLVTGQEKLEDASEATTVGKLKERFPAPLRVHLATTNIRDVVHRRLLKKAPRHEPLLRELFQRHRADLKLNAYGCEDITEEDFVEVYPLLPEHVNLLLRVTTALRTRSTRIQGDDHAIRGLLQLLGELFRTQALAEQELGRLVTLDSIFEVQQTALDSETQATLARTFSHSAVRGDALAEQVVKAVALLELIQEQEATTAELVARCLYERLGQGSRLAEVTQVLERLREANLLGYSEKHGYKLQSSAGQEWQRERADVNVTHEQRSELVHEKLTQLLGGLERPRLRNQPFPWSAWYSDSRQARDVRLVDPRAEATFPVDFRFINRDDREGGEWVRKSAEEALLHRLVWVVGELGPADQLAAELKRSRRMCEKYKVRSQSLSSARQRLLAEEQARSEELDKRLAETVADVFHAGTLYFRGRALQPREHGHAFGTALLAVGNKLLPELYPHFTDIAITSSELEQLFGASLAGASTKFFDSGLGVLSVDAGQVVASGHGPVPSGLLRFIESRKGTSGATLLAHFGRPPYGYPTDVVKACLVGLLRGGKVRIRPREKNHYITSVKDPGAKDLFGERELRGADIFPAGDGPITPRDRNAICQFFKKSLDVEVDRTDDAIADAAYAHFLGQRERLRGVEGLLEQLPGRPPLPPALARLARALEDCRRSRQREETVLALKQHLDTLKDGLEQLNLYAAELTDTAVAQLARAARVKEVHLAQLEALGGVDVAADGAALRAALAVERPWREQQSLQPVVQRLEETYVAVRQRLLGQQETLADHARIRLRGRAGFERLTAEQAGHVLKPITDAVVNTPPDAVAPPLLDLQDRFEARLTRAEEEANDRLDQALSETQPQQVRKVDAGLQGRELTSEAELDATLRELEERVRPLLRQGFRVRLT